MQELHVASHDGDDGDDDVGREAEAAAAAAAEKAAVHVAHVALAPSLSDPFLPQPVCVCVCVCLCVCEKGYAIKIRAYAEDQKTLFSHALLKQLGAYHIISYCTLFANHTYPLACKTQTMPTASVNFLSTRWVLTPSASLNTAPTPILALLPSTASPLNPRSLPDTCPNHHTCRTANHHTCGTANHPANSGVKSSK